MLRFAWLTIPLVQRSTTDEMMAAGVTAAEMTAAEMTAAEMTAAEVTAAVVRRPPLRREEDPPLLHGAALHPPALS